MTDNTPTVSELWTVLQEEKAERQNLQAEIKRLQTALKKSNHNPLSGGTVSRGGLLAAAGIAGAGLLGLQGGVASAQTPPPIPSFTAFPDPRRVFSQTMTNGQTSGTVTTSSAAVPAGASAAYCAVQAMPSTLGPLTLYPDGSPDPGIANWEAIVVGVNNLFYMLVPLSTAGNFRIHSYINAAVNVDVWGYLY